MSPISKSFLVIQHKMLIYNTHCILFLSLKFFLLGIYNVLLVESRGRNNFVILSVYYCIPR